VRDSRICQGALARSYYADLLSAELIGGWQPEIGMAAAFEKR
jgi:hypothetical protein